MKNGAIHEKVSAVATAPAASNSPSVLPFVRLLLQNG